MQYLTQDVNVGIADWLLGEEIMGHKRHTAGEVSWQLFPTLLDNRFEVLHNKRRSREFPGDGNRC